MMALELFTSHGGTLTSLYSHLMNNDSTHYNDILLEIKQIMILEFLELVTGQMRALIITTYSSNNCQLVALQ